MFLLNFLKYLILLNPIKIFFLVFALFLYFIPLNYVDKYETSYIYVLATFEDSGKHYYVSNDGNHTIYSFEEKKELNNNKFKDVTFTIKYRLILTLIVISSLLVIILTIINDSYVGWEFKKVINKSYLKMLRMDEENGNYYYHLNGKLIRESKKILSSYDLGNVGTFYLDNKNILPDFKGTKKSIRDKRLKDLLS